MRGHGESALSRTGFSGSFFFLSPKIPKIFCKGLFFFSTVLLGSLEVPCAPTPLGSGCPVGFPFTVSGCGGFGEPPPKICERKEPPAVAGPSHPRNSQKCVGAGHG